MNCLQLKEVVGLQHFTCYTHQTLLDAQLFIFGLSQLFILAAAMR